MPQKNNKTPSIISDFAKELGQILHDYLIEPERDNPRIPLNDRLAIKLILTLNKRLYQRELLFRDYGQQKIDYVMADGSSRKINEESIVYLQDVLAKRLSIVSKQKTRPNNLHILLLMLFRYSEDCNWQRTRIRRKKIDNCVQDDFFTKIANKLQKKCATLKNISAYSQNCREKHGALQLIAGNNNAEIMEEISLFDVFDLTPKPLREDIRTRAVWYPYLMEKILASLNSQYGLLRSCGLRPQEWHGKLSDGKLRDLKKLKQQADDHLNSGEKQDNKNAYEQAFANLQQHRKKVAGFESFVDFVYSEVGIALLKTEILPLENSSDDEGEKDLLEKMPTVDSDPLMELEFETLLEEQAAQFSSMNAYLFRQLIIKRRPWHTEHGVLNDTEFKCLLAESDEYQGLEDEKITQALTQKLQAFIKKHLPNLSGDSQ